MLDSALQLLKQQADGERSAVEIAEQAIRSVEASQPTHNAYTSFDRELALRAAESVDERRAAGETLGVLAGVPVAVKDVLCTKDLPTTCASKMLQSFRPPYDATVVAKLRAADAVILGKTNMDEFAMGASTETSFFGVTRNPWDLDRTAGGSSGGSASAVAAQTAPLSLGTDTGGSIRQPSAFCGLTGMKPTYGRVSRFGLVAFASSLDQVGPMAWSAQDCSLLLQAISGFEPRDSTSLDQPVPDYLDATQTTDLRGVRVGVLRKAMATDGVSESIRSAVNHSTGVFAELGAEIIEIDLPHREYWVPTYYVIAPSEASSNLSRFDGAHYGHRSDKSIDLEAMYRRSRGEGFGAEVKRRIMIGTYALSEGYSDQYYNQALKVRRLIRNDYDAAFSQVDLMLGPVTPTPAFELGDKVDDPLQMYLCDLFTVGANLAGVPAISIPGGFDENGMPIGIQLQAPALEESRLLSAAAAFQSLTDYHTKRPPNPSGN
ncbi:MAG: Asp-tRNA(Asn)/Glu-tRNA(Gln) amidotransferase subunit GatA [Planctomycetota bacterium]